MSDGTNIASHQCNLAAFSIFGTICQIDHSPHPLQKIPSLDKPFYFVFFLPKRFVIKGVTVISGVFGQVIGGYKGVSDIP